MKTTLNKIREHSPCAEGWAKLLKHLGKTQADDAELDLLTILESNGFDDALWCFRAVDGFDREKRLYAVWCARQVEHLNSDPRVKACNDVAERFANGLCTIHDLEASRAAARDAWAAAGDAAGAARAAAWAASRAAGEAGEAGEAAGAAQKAEFLRMLQEGYK